MRSRLCPVRLPRAHVHPCTISTSRSPSSPPSCIDQLDGYFNGKTAPWEASSSPGSGVAAPSQRALTPEQPVVPDPTWKRRGLSAYGGLNRTDPDAIWSFQGWAIVDWNTHEQAQSLRGFIDATPEDKFVIIDMSVDGTFERKPPF